MDSSNIRGLNLRLAILRGLNFDGSHPEDDAVDPRPGPGNVGAIEPHTHDVSLDVLRIQLEADYVLSKDWILRLRVPYDMKSRTAGIGFPPGTSGDQIGAMEANLENHHGTEMLEGFSDLKFLVAHPIPNWPRERDLASIAIGTTIPVGRTQDDPLVAGANNEAHEHIQFGTGTFDPIIEAFWRRPITDDVSLSLNLIGKLPFDTNSKGFEPSEAFSGGLDLRRDMSDKASIHAGWNYLYEGQARWNGVEDPNSGLRTQYLTLGVSRLLNSGLRVDLDYTFPIEQETLSDVGDGFEIGNSFQLGLSWGLN